MRVKRISEWAFRQKTGAASSKIILITLAKYADISGTVKITVTGLMAITELTRQTVFKRLQVLEEKKIIVIRRQTGTGATTVFVITLTPRYLKN